VNEIDNILIERECLSLMVNYNFYLDSMEIDRYLSLWTEDCVFKSVVPAPGLEVSGHDGLRMTIDRLFSQPNRIVRHLLSNAKITVHSPDNAEGFCVGLAIHGQLNNGSLPATLAGISLVGEYRDEYRRTAQGWKIARRELTRVIDIKTD
jgi:ketosteroid isomerase-like protein